MDQLFKAICCLLFLQVTVIFSEMEIESRIVGGIDANIDEIPFLVQVWFEGSFGCGGIRTSPRHIVTAAHCVFGRDAEKYTVVAGATMLGESGIRADVSKTIVHPDYNYSTFDQDIAVMKLRTPLSGPSLLVPWGWGITIEPGDVVELYGWGRLSENQIANSKQLQTVAVQVVGNVECDLMYGARGYITENMFCATSPGKDSCAGDSGGPVLVNGKVFGIVSWGRGCANADFPGVYTKITSTRTLQFLRNNLLPYELNEFHEYWS